MTVERLALAGGLLIVASGLATGAALAQAGLPWLLLPLAVTAVGWLAWWLRGRRGGGGPGAAVTVVLALAAAAVFRNSAVLVWAYAGALGTLAAWDVSVFFGRITAVNRHDALDRLITRHLAALAVVLLIAALGLVARQLWQQPLAFDRTLLLAAALIYGLARLLRAVWSES